MDDKEYIESNRRRLEELEMAIQEAEASMDIEGRLRAVGIDKAEADRAVSEFIQQASPELQAAARQKVQEAERAEQAARAQAISDMSKTASGGAVPARRPRTMV
jgi:hypothetical protein